jgi:hypothetical protein
MRTLESAHSRYRPQLEELVHGEALLLAVEEAGLQWGWSGRAWTRMHERFEPGCHPYATCVLATADVPQQVVRVQAFRERPETGTGARDCRAGVAGWLRVTRFPSDPALTTLERVLAAHRRSTVVRYRPGRRCTIRIDGERSRFVKVYANGAGRRAHANSLELWRVAQRGELGFVVAEPERYDDELCAVWHRSVVGEPVRRRLRGARAEGLARRLGGAAGTLGRSSLRSSRRRELQAELQRSRLKGAELERRIPELGERVRRLLAALEDAHADLDPPGAPRPVHGALHLSQWLDGDAGFALLDYDSLVLGDPELDAATFLADLDVENRERVPVDRLATAFVSGFADAVGTLDPRRLATYRAHGRLEKALRVARAVRPDGDRKAGRRLRLALECLEEAA